MEYKEYKGYRIFEKENGIIIENVKDFNLVHTFECGQCFRWTRESNGSFTGVVRDKAVNVLLEGENLIIENATFNDFIDLWYDYFDLGRDYSEIKRVLSRKDEIMRKAIDFGYGIRILRQDFWETLISFIISANNRIPMIKKTVEQMSRKFGKEIEFNGKTYYTFPSVEKLAEECIESLQVCGGGFRCKYISETAKMVRNGEIDLSLLYVLDRNGARKTLEKLPGVGPKVADCTLLYSGIKYDVFPTDVWVKRVMEELYFHRTASLTEIQKFASDYFSELAGFAQQYLFYYARENRIGTN